MDILKYFVPTFLMELSPEIFNKREWVVARALSQEFKNENHYEKKSSHIV